METLYNIKHNWDEFAASDPLWSILPLPEKKNNAWSPEELFETGRKEIKSVMNYIDALNMRPGNNKALDFGCGVGRLTQALADYYDTCYGVDISGKMLELAAHYNHYGERCIYVLNDTSDLRIFKDTTFDFIYSNIVFQHIPPLYSLRYIREFLRTIKPDGLIIFQITVEQLPIFGTRLRNFIKRIMPIQLRRLYKRLRYGTWAIKDMYCIRKEDLDNFIEGHGGRIIDTVSDPSTLPRYKGLRYCIKRKE